MRVAVGGIEHESNSFLLNPTPLRTFDTWSRAGNTLCRFGEANNIIDGLVCGVRQSGMELVPLYWTYGSSGGLPAKQTYVALKERLLQPLRAALPLDGVLLSLHGAFSAEGVDDADGDILQAVRMIVGPSCPIIAVHDLHSNISPLMVSAADALIVEKTYPHTDMAVRGEEAARLMFRTLRGEVRPTMGYRPLPLFWSAAHMITSKHPMKRAMEELDRTLEHPAVLTASLSVGYQWADSPIVGTSTVVVTDNDRRTAQASADAFAKWIWDRRTIWQREPVTPEQALKAGERTSCYPIILADQADNTGGGAPGDSTEILRLFVERRLRDAAVLYVVDPETATAAHRAGVGAKIDVHVGGKSHPLLGPPVSMHAEVMALSDGRFTYDGPMWAGKEDFAGTSALLRQNDIYVVVITCPRQPVDLSFTRNLGLDCRRLRYICVKSTGHFRSGFEPIAGSIYNVDAAGLLTHEFRRLPFRRLGRKIYPIDRDAAVAWETLV